MNLEERYLDSAAKELFPEPEGIVEVLPPIRDPDQFSATATKREGGVGFVEGAAPSAVSGGGKTVTTTPQAGQVTQPAQKQLTQEDVNKMIADPAYRFDSVSNQLRDIFNKEPQSELIPLNRSMREDLSYSMQQILVDKFGVDNYRAGRLADTLFGGERSGAPMGLGLVDATPLVIPLSFQESGISAGKSFEQFDRGNYGQAALEYGTGMLQSAEAIPAVGMAVKGLKAGAKALAPNAASMMEQGLRKSGMITDIVPDGKSVAQQAAKSDIGFYSAVENAAINVQRKSGTGQSFLNDIMKGENVKAEEIKWMGLDEFLKGKKNVTKQEVQDYIASNKVDVQEVTLGGNKNTFTDPEKAIAYIGEREGWTPREVMENWGYADKKDYIDLANEMAQKDPTNGSLPAKFGSYTLAGGENYREILLTTPTEKSPFDKFLEDMSNKYGADTPRNQWSSEDNIALDKYIKGDYYTDAGYRSSHFDQPNILAHLRVNDRVDADGKKMLLIEEVQSDWHQAGRKKGYKSAPSEEDIKRVMDGSNYMNRADAIDYLTNNNAVPDAPFKDTWYQLALKRALQYAAENGYERVGLTTGKQQADRYRLSNYIDALYPTKELDGTYSIEATRKGDGEIIMVAENIKESQISDYVGKDIANKIINEKLDLGEDFEISGIDLSVGGEGMKKYYDEIYPKFLEKYGKKWNAKMGETKINPKEMAWKYGLDVKDINIPVRYIDITPEMKAGVQKGQPLFAAAPIGAATGTAAMQDERKK